MSSGLSGLVECCSRTTAFPLPNEIVPGVGVDSSQLAGRGHTLELGLKVDQVFPRLWCHGAETTVRERLQDATPESTIFFKETD